MMRMWGKWNPCMMSVGMQSGSAIMENRTGWGDSQIFKILLPYDPVIPKEIKSGCQRDIHIPVFIAATF
jgi:hypothetical protein